MCLHEEKRSLTSSEFKDFADEHEAGFSQGVSPAVTLVAVVGEVAVIVSILLSTSTATNRGRGVGRLAGRCQDCQGCDASVMMLELWC